MPHQDPDDPKYTQPQSLKDTLKTILGSEKGLEFEEAGSVLLGREAAAGTFPFAPNKVFTKPEFKDNRFVLAHEVGHLVDFADILPNEAEIKAILEARPEEEGERDRLIANRTLREGAHRLGILKEDPLVSERFVNEFETALNRLEDKPADEVQRKLREFIQDRLNRNVEQQKRLIQNPPAAAQSSTAISR